MVDTLHPPPSIIASWPIPNYVNPPQRGPEIVYVFAILGLLSVAIVATRIYARCCITKAAGIDDILITIGLILTLAFGSLIVVGHEKFQSGRHIWDIDPRLFPSHRLNLWISQWFYLYASATIKISVLLFYRRLSVSFTRRFLWAVYAGIAFTVLVLVAFSMYLLLLCSPIQSYWTSYDFRWLTSHKFTCGSETVSLPLSAALNAFGDGYSTLLPMLLVGQTAQPFRQRLALYGLFALGFLAMGAGIVRTVFLYQILNVYWDNSWLLTPMWAASLVELFLAIFAASAPALKPFFKSFFKQTMSVVYSSKRRSVSTPASFNSSVVKPDIKVQHQRRQIPSSIYSQGDDDDNNDTTHFRNSRVNSDTAQVYYNHYPNRTKSFPLGSWIEFDEKSPHHSLPLPPAAVTNQTVVDSRHCDTGLPDPDIPNETESLQELKRQRTCSMMTNFTTLTMINGVAHPLRSYPPDDVVRYYQQQQPQLQQQQQQRQQYQQRNPDYEEHDWDDYHQHHDEHV